MGDANDRRMLARAFRAFKVEANRPTLIIVDSRIGYGAPTKEGTHGAHGEPLGVEEIRGAKRFYGWPEDETFLVPDEVYAHFAAGIGARGRKLREEWETRFAAYRLSFPELAAELEHMQQRTLPEDWDADIPTFPADPKGLAGREANGKVLNAVGARVPWLVGGSSDLAPSTKTLMTFEGAGDFLPGQWAGRNLHFGVREHAAGCIANGLSLSKVRPYQSGFLIFSDFQRGAIRLSALMEIPVIHLFTHDSIGVGEDGPTHQPVEQIVSLRAMPGLVDIRPADANEVAEAWRVVMPMRHEPVAMFLSRQALPTLDRTAYAPASGLARGAYVLADPPGGEDPAVILIGSGSEVALVVDAYEALTAEGIPARVVSMPSWALFDRQDEAYRTVGAAGLRPGPGRRRGGLHPGLGALRTAGRHHRDVDLRRLGPPQGAADQVRLHPRGGPRHGQGADRPARRLTGVRVRAKGPIHGNKWHLPTQPNTGRLYRS